MASLFFLVALSTMLLVFTVPQAESAPWSTVQLVTEARYNWLSGDIKTDGRWAVWASRDKGNPNIEEIHAYDLLTGRHLLLTDDYVADRWPAIWNGYVVWASASTGLMLYDTRTGVKQSIVGLWTPYPSIDAGSIVWSSYDGDQEVYSYQIADGATTQLTNNTVNDMDPVVGSEFVAWSFGSYAGWGDTEIALYQFSTGMSTRLTDNEFPEQGARISGNLVVWQSYGQVEHEAEIFVHDLQSGESRHLTSNGYTDWWPETDGSLVAWLGCVDQGNEDVFVWDRATDTTRRITNTPAAEWSLSVAHGLVAWMAQDLSNPTSNHTAVYVYDSRDGSVVALKDDGLNDFAPAVSPSGKVFWEKETDSSAGGLYVAVPAGTRIMSAGWNILAGGPGSDTGGTPLFGYTGAAYQSTGAGDMTPGQGYWAKFAGKAIPVLSTVAPPLSIGLVPGWNLIGNSTGVSLTLPDGMTTFTFDASGYTSTTTLLPGQGAWIKASSAGDIVLEP